MLVLLLYIVQSHWSLFFLIRYKILHLALCCHSALVPVFTPVGNQHQYKYQKKYGTWCGGKAPFSWAMNEWKSFTALYISIFTIFLLPVVLFKGRCMVQEFRQKGDLCCTPSCFCAPASYVTSGSKPGEEMLEHVQGASSGLSPIERIHGGVNRLPFASSWWQSDFEKFHLVRFQSD